MSYSSQVQKAGLSSVVVFIVFATGSGVTNAYDGKAYWTDRSGNIVRTRFDECVRTRAWAPERATLECDPALVAELEQDEKSQRPTAVAVVTAYVAPVNLLHKAAVDTETYFSLDSAELRPEAEQGLRSIADRIQSFDQVEEIRIVGHADRIGPQQYNEEIALARAEKVEQYLTEKTRIKSSKFVVRSAGESNPQVKCVAFDSTEKLVDCLQPNRRVEIEVLGRK